MDKNIENTILRYFEGTASAEDEKSIRKWLNASPENRRIFFRERKIYDAILLCRRKENNTRKNVKVKALTRELLRIAAAVAIVLGLNFLYQTYKSTEEEDAFQTLYVPAGQRINVILPDSTDVWLNARTTLTYPASFKGKERNVRLDGEAYFKVAKNKNKPFVVETEKFRIKALGTEFNVLSYKESSYFETMLSQGKVAIYSNGNYGNPLLLSPNNKAYCENGGALRVAAVDDMNAYRWREGLICFKNSSFKDIMTNFEKYYGQRIVVENKNVGKHSYTGKFRQSDGLDYALRVLQKDISFKYERDEEKGIIYIK